MAIMTLAKTRKLAGLGSFSDKLGWGFSAAMCLISTRNWSWFSSGPGPTRTFPSTRTAIDRALCAWAVPAIASKNATPASPRLLRSLHLSCFDQLQDTTSNPKAHFIFGSRLCHGMLCPGPRDGPSRKTGLANMASISSGVADPFRAFGVAGYTCAMVLRPV